MMPLVTILIPTYSRARFLREALQSAVSQTYQNLEILILDDASPDETAAVAAEFAGDPRVQYIRHTQNLGIVGNWRAGIERARGEFFCLLHDDDTFESTFVERLLEPLRADPSLILAFCDHWVMDRDGSRMPEASDNASCRFQRGRLQEGPIQHWAELALIAVSIPVGATLFRTSRVSPSFIDDRAKGAIDIWLFYQCVKSGMGIYYHPCRLMNYRLHSGGMSRSAGLYMGDGHIFRCQEILADPQMATLYPQIRRQLAAILTAYGIDLLVEGYQKEAQSSLKQSLSLQSSKRAFVAYGLACTGPIGAAFARAIRSR